MGTPRVIRMNAAATSNAIGTGRNAPANATSTIPKKLTCEGITCAGTTSATTAPNRAARIMNGIVVAASRVRFFPYCFTVPEVVTIHPADGTWHCTSTGLVPFTSQGTMASSASGTATRSNATPGGNSANTMVSTTTFNMGD